VRSIGGGKGFQQALEEARRGRSAAKDESEGGLASLKALPLDFGRTRGGGGDARWGLAMSWTSESDERAPDPAALAREPSAVELNMKSIVAEVGIDTAASEEQLMRRWRAFLWRNHPDLQPPHARARADARVAIANSLYQQARQRLRKSR
jgi:hypothetical protein